MRMDLERSRADDKRLFRDEAALLWGGGSCGRHETGNRVATARYRSFVDRLDLAIYRSSLLGLRLLGLGFRVDAIGLICGRRAIPAWRVGPVITGRLARPCGGYCFTFSRGEILEG